MTIWGITVQNNATKEIITNWRVAEEHELYIKFAHSGNRWWLDTLPDGEYTYYVWPMALGPERNLDTDNGGSTVLDADVVDLSTGERVTLRDLNPYVGLLRIGDVPVTANNYDDTDNNRYYYDKEK